MGYRKMSEEHKQKLRKPKPKGFGEKISKKLRGRKLSNKHKENVSLSMKGCTPWNKGLTADSDMRVKKNKENTIKTKREKSKYKNIEVVCPCGNKFFYKYENRGARKFCSFECAIKEKKYSEETKEKIRVKRAFQKIPFKDSSIEVIFQKELDKIEILYEKHKPILGQPDIFIEPNICIFIDGCYWHGCEQCFNKNKFSGHQRARIVRDQFVTQGLINLGYIILRFWEHEVRNEIGKCIDRVIDTTNGKINVIGDR